MGVLSALKSRGLDIAPASVIRTAKKARDKWLDYRDRDSALREIMASDAAALAAEATTEQLSGKKPAGLTLIASTGVANIGDQAMLDSVLSNMSSNMSDAAGSVEVGLKDGATYRIPTGVQTFDSTALIYGAGSARDEARQRLIASLYRTGRLGIVGADIIDGGYQRGVAVKSWSIAAAAAHAGFDTRIFGFSWGENIDPLVIEAAQTAVVAGVRAIARDSISAARFAADTGREPVAGGDLVFSLTWPKADSPVAINTAYALVNISGLIASRVDISDDMVAVCQAIRDSGRKIILVPHVANRGGDDIAAIAEFAQKLQMAGLKQGSVGAGEAAAQSFTAFADNSDFIALDKLYTPGDIAMLARDADFVVTGRMHLSILAMNQHTPAIVLATQGKVEGLLADVGLPQYAVAPVPGCATAIEACISDIGDNAALRQEVLEAGVAKLRARSAENFVDLA